MKSFFYLPIWIGIQIQLLSPGKIPHAPLNSIRVCPIIVPHVPFNSLLYDRYKMVFSHTWIIQASLISYEQSLNDNPSRI